MKLEFPSFDGEKHARVGHGLECVVILIETPEYTPAGHGVILAPKEAAALGRRLIQQARASQKLEPGERQ